MADIEVLTDDLRQFAGQGAMRVQLEAIAPLTTSAGTGAGLMDESRELQTADRESTDAMMRYLTEVDQGMTGYRVGVAEIADVYDRTEGAVLTTLNNVLPQEQNLPAVDVTFDLAKIRTMTPVPMELR